MTQYAKDHPDTIASLFDTIAPQYDKANTIMSLNLHKKWNRILANVLRNNGEPRQYLDLCSGTGEIAFTALKDMPHTCEAFLLDFSENMLSIARKKEAVDVSGDHRIHYLHADAQQIPLPSQSIDAVTIAYGIRNVQDPARCVREVGRVLRPGGIFAILELTQPKNAFMKLGHKLYMKTFLPLVGKFVASDKQAYSYLCNSIQEFLRPEELEDVMKSNGFHKTKILPLNGGIATIITGIKQ